MKKIKKIGIPCENVGLVTNKDGTPKFLEVIIKRPERYSNPGLTKSVPKTHLGVKVKAL